MAEPRSRVCEPFVDKREAAYDVFQSIEGEIERD